ncbi:MAG TPA: hypothetical protein VLK89_06300 [Solirubrobacterales bacterium]|nr:hypothetical protein [Solirubrobacterales bacterium]
MAAATARKAAAAPARAPRRKRPALAVAPARKAPARKPAPVRRKAPARRPGGQLIPIAFGTASAVRKLPDSGLVVRMTRGRTWIGVLGVLLVGIVALNVVTLSLAADAGHIDQNIQALDEENSILRSRDAQKSGVGRIRHEAAALGLSAAPIDQVGAVQASPRDVETAARRLAAAGSAY